MKIARYIAIFVVFAFVALFGFMAMSPKSVEFIVNQDVAKGRSEVFSKATNPELMRKWISGVSKVKGIKGEHGVSGSSYNLHFGDGDNSMVMAQEVKKMTKDSLFTYEGVVEDFMQVNSTSVFKEVDSATTRISTKVSIKALSYKMRLFMNNKKSFKENAGKNYETLANYIEVSE